ncbi:hypothetical protein HGRIS_010113 [Hohenbuehelia grisea]|uniref:Nop14-like protein n=1 Tax=Hohenbuehelia grisea TaxID=104357 RepID=A0ABR3J392_9AGAR
MAKGSQLSQLKAALANAGVTGQQPNGKKRKRGNPAKDNEKKAAKLREIEQRLNPFDVKVTKLKHDVGGRRIKGVAGRPAQSKQAGIEQRKKTLLKEYEEKGHSGGIIDRRFGENDPTMGLEERMLERFTRERQRASRGTAFNLEDEDELTHYGQSLSKLDDFDNVGLNIDKSDDEDPGHLDRGIVAKTHFGGFDDEDEDDGGEDEPARKKSKAEVMAEVIAKSKEHKMLRQMDRERTENIRHQLDEEFDSIRELLFAQEPSAADQDPTNLPSVSSSAPQAVTDNDYDTRVRELAFDQRAKAKDRTKTEEELALEQKEALEKAERQRRRRMLGLEDSDNEEESRGKRKRGGDDLEDDFYADGDGDGWAGLGAGLESQFDDNGDESASEVDGEDSGVDEDSEQETDSDGEDNEDDEDFSDDGEDSSDDEPGEHEELVSSKSTPKSKSKPRKTRGELPYTFPCPSNHEEFLDIIDGVDDNDIPVVVQRIMTLHHPSLAPDNKLKLQALSTVLIDYIIFIASLPSPRLGLLPTLLPHLLDLVRKYPSKSAEHFVAKLRLMHQNLRRGLSLGAVNTDAKTWPSLPELTFLRVIGRIWPTSDMHHVVVSPARILMGGYLGLCRVRSLSDIASGLFICSLFLQYEELAKRFVPEAVNFAVATILHLAPHQYKDASALPGAIYVPDFRSELCLPLSLNAKAARKTVRRKPQLLSLLVETSEAEQGKVDLLNTAFDLLSRFSELYKGLDGFIELYQPIYEVLANISSKSLPESVKDSFTSLQSATTRLLKFARQSRAPLLLQAHKPIPIATYIPKFESSSSSYLRRQDPDHERNEASKLRYQLKKERKGAIRELRKDAKFLAAVQQEKQKEKDRSYNDRMKRVFGSLEGERAEQKAMEREKSRDKKRAGKK